MTCLMERTSKSGMGQRTIHQQGFKGNSCKDLVLEIMMQHIGGKRSAKEAMSTHGKFGNYI